MTLRVHVAAMKKPVQLVLGILFVTGINFTYLKMKVN